MAESLLKTVGQFSKHYTYSYHATQQFHSWYIYPREWKNRCSNRNMYTSVYNSTTYNSQKVETTKFPSTDEWINKILFSHTKGVKY